MHWDRFAPHVMSYIGTVLHHTQCHALGPSCTTRNVMHWDRLAPQVMSCIGTVLHHTQCHALGPFCPTRNVIHWDRLAPHAMSCIGTVLHHTQCHALGPSCITDTTRQQTNKQNKQQKTTYYCPFDLSTMGIRGGGQGGAGGPRGALIVFGRIFVSSKYMLTLHHLLFCPSLEQFLLTSLLSTD